MAAVPSATAFCSASLSGKVSLALLLKCSHALFSVCGGKHGVRQFIRGQHGGIFRHTLLMLAQGASDCTHGKWPVGADFGSVFPGGFQCFPGGYDFVNQSKIQRLLRRDMFAAQQNLGRQTIGNLAPQTNC